MRSRVAVFATLIALVILASVFAITCARFAEEANEELIHDYPS